MSLHAQQRRLRHLRRILTPLDGTAEANQAVEYAADLAVRANARLLMLHVMGHDPAFARRHVAPAYSDQSHHEVEAWREEFERRGFATIQRPVALNAEAVLRAGDPSRVIVDYANEQDCDLIVRRGAEASHRAGYRSCAGCSRRRAVRSCSCAPRFNARPRWVAISQCIRATVQ